MEISSNIQEIIAGTAVVVTAGALGFKKLLASISKDNAILSANNAANEVVNLLRDQMQDLAQSNKSLREEVEKLRLVNLELQAENRNLREEIHDLRDFVENHLKTTCSESCPILLNTQNARRI